MSLRQIAIAFDQLVNAALGGYADETMSARCWRLQRFYPYRFLRPLIDTIFFWQPNHCHGAYQSEIDRKQMPYSYTQQNMPR